jgi:AcrR family transcriptional regulator
MKKVGTNSPQATKRKKSKATGKKVSGRDKIIQAIRDILLEHGPGKLSLEAILLESRVSKGGFFYYFKTKEEALVEAYQNLFEKFEIALMKIIEQDPVETGRTLRAMIDLYLSQDALFRKKEFKAMGLGMVALMNENPSLLKVIRERDRHIEDKIMAEGISWEFAQIAGQVLDGIWLSESLGLDDFENQQRERLRRYLHSLLKSEINK